MAHGEELARRVARAIGDASTQQRAASEAARVIRDAGPYRWDG